jgi:hypothetical protein
MILDLNTIFTTTAGQAITSATTTNSTDTIDLSPLTAPNAAGGTNTFRDIGTGDNLYLVATLLTGSVTTVTSPTVRVDIQTADDTGFSVNARVVSVSPTVSLPTTTATAAAGARLIVMRLPTESFRRYLRAQIVTAGTITTASYTIFAGLVLNADAGLVYADGITIQ